MSLHLSSRSSMLRRATVKSVNRSSNLPTYVPITVILCCTAFNAAILSSIVRCSFVTVVLCRSTIKSISLVKRIISLCVCCNSSFNVCCFGASSFRSNCSCRNAAFNTSFSSSYDVIRFVKSVITASRDCISSSIADLFCCNVIIVLSNSFTLFLSFCNAVNNVDRAVS